MAFRDDVLALTPTVYWRLGEPSGVTAQDETGNNIDGTYSNVVLGAASCLVGDADTSVRFDDDGNSKCDVSGVSGLPTAKTDPFTIMFIHRTRVQVSLAHYFGFGTTPNGAQTNGTRRGMLCFNGSYYVWGENADWDTGVTFDFFGPGSAIGNFIALTSDGADLRLYRDGALAAGPQAVPAAWVAAGTVVTAGSHHPSGNSPDGDIDECAIFNACLTAVQVAALESSRQGASPPPAAPPCGWMDVFAGVVPAGRGEGMTAY